jgi:hypothetical protein
LVYKVFGACKEEYHGGDYNGNSCREIVANSEAICEKVVGELVLKQKTDGASEERIGKKVNGYERILGTIDA